MSDPLPSPGYNANFIFILKKSLFLAKRHVFGTFLHVVFMNEKLTF